MTGHVARAGLQVAPVFAEFVEARLLPGLSISAEEFWSGYESLLRDLVPENRRLLSARADLQRQIDTWLEERRGKAWDNDAWISFLREIGYLVPEGPAFEVATETVDPEISTVAGPQLVVPVSNARFALNAANARWGSLYDALYGTDALPGKPQGGGYDAERGAAAVARAAEFLDEALPLATGRHADVGAWRLEDGKAIAVIAGCDVELANPAAFVGHSGEGEKRRLLFRHNGLHIELVFDPSHPVGAASPSGLRDVVLEAALTGPPQSSPGRRWSVR